MSTTEKVKKAIVILSGGQDSATCLALAERDGYALYALTFQYGQKHSREVKQAEQIASWYQVQEHRLVDLAFLRDLGGSALTDATMTIREQGEDQGIPTTYVPARNLIFISLATAYAEVIGAEAIYIGVSAVDYSGYPDCRPEFIQSMQQTVRLATKAGTKTADTDSDIAPRLQIKTPLIHLSKAETVRIGVDLGVPFHLTTTCYHGRLQACGLCDSCRLRIKGFQEAGVIDPVPYAVEVNWQHCQPLSKLVKR